MIQSDITSCITRRMVLQLYSKMCAWVNPLILNFTFQHWQHLRLNYTDTVNLPFTWMVSASRLLHPYRPDGVLVPLLPQCPVLIQRRCGEEAPALSNCTGRQCSHLSLCDCLSTQEAVQIYHPGRSPVWLTGSGRLPARRESGSAKLQWGTTPPSWRGPVLKSRGVCLMLYLHTVY